MSKLDVEKRNANRSWNGHNVPISAQPTDTDTLRRLHGRIPAEAGGPVEPLKSTNTLEKPALKKRPYNNMSKQQISAFRRSDGRKELNCTLDVEELLRLSVDGKIKVIIYQDDTTGKMCMTVNPYRSGAL